MNVRTVCARVYVYVNKRLSMILKVEKKIVLFFNFVLNKIQDTSCFLFLHFNQDSS